MSGFVRLADYFAITGFDYENCRHYEGCGKLIQRLPQKEWDNVPYVFHIEDFCQPHGWYIQQERQRPVFFVVHLSDISGNKFYCACLAFSELVPPRYAQQFSSSPSRKPLSSKQAVDHDFFVAFFVPPTSYGSPKASGQRPLSMGGEPNTPQPPTLFAPKCLSLIASHNHFEILKNSLSVLYAVYVNEGNKYSLERIVASILSSVDVPLPGGPRTVFSLGAGDRQTILPPRFNSVPVTKRAVYLLLRQFGIQNVLLLVAATLTDSKILLCSRTMTRLSEAAFALTALIYPIQFEYSSVPILPKRLMEMISAPTPYIFGIHIDCLSDIPDVCDVYIADLDGGSVMCPSDGSLPSRILEPFYQNTFSLLVQIFSPDLLTADNLFDTKSRIASLHGDGDIWLDKHLRAVFMSTIIHILSGYRSCLTVTRISPQAVIHFDKSLFVLLRGFQDHDQFIQNLLSSQLFDSFIRRRGPPFRVCDIFDEMYGKFVLCGEFDEGVPASLDDDTWLELVATISQRLGENENVDIEAIQELPPFVQSCCDARQYSNFPLLDDSMVSKHMTEFYKKKRPSQTNVITVEPRFVPQGFDLRKRLNIPHLFHEKRLVIRQFLSDIFNHHMTEALRRKNTIIQDLQSRHIRRIFVDELRHVVMDSANVSSDGFPLPCATELSTSLVATPQPDKLTLVTMEQFELIISLLSETLSKNGASDESCIGATIMQLSHNICMETDGSKLRYYAYMTPQIQEHAIWENQTFWETAFCSEVNRQLREVYLYHSESQHQSSNSDTSSSKKVDLACPVYSNRMSLLEIAAEELKVRPHRDPEVQKQLEKQEENCISAIITHFITLIVQFRLPLSIAQGLANSVAPSTSKSAGGASLRTRTASKPSLTLMPPLSAEGEDETVEGHGQIGDLSEGRGSYSHLSEEQRDSDAESGTEPPLNTSRQVINNLEIWLTKFITKVAHENHLSDRRLADALSKTEFIIEGHLNELEMIYGEVSSMRWNRQPEVMRPILLPEEIGVRVLGRDRLHCFLLATGHYDSICNLTENLLFTYVNSANAASRGGRRVNGSLLAGAASSFMGGNGMDISYGLRTSGGSMSLLPAQGCLFLTNYRVIFNGLPMDPFQSNKPLTVSFPISSILQVRKIGGGSRRLYSAATGEEHVLELMSIRSACMQSMIVGLENLPPMDHVSNNGASGNPTASRLAENDVTASATIRAVRNSALSRSGSISSAHSWSNKEMVLNSIAAAAAGGTGGSQAIRQQLSGISAAFQIVSASTLREELRNLLLALRYPQRVDMSFLDLNDFVASDSYLIFNYQNHNVTGERPNSSESRKSRTHSSKTVPSSQRLGPNSSNRQSSATSSGKAYVGISIPPSVLANATIGSGPKNSGSGKNVPLSTLTATIQRALPASVTKTSKTYKQEPQHDFQHYLEQLTLQPGYRDLMKQNLMPQKMSDSYSVRVSHANLNYSLCDTYPAFLILPKIFPEENVEKLAKSFHNNRLPTIVWRHPTTSAFLLRSGNFQLKKYHHITSMFSKAHGSALPASHPVATPDSSSPLVSSIHVQESGRSKSGGAGDSYLTREQEQYLRCLVQTTRSAMSVILESDDCTEQPLIANRSRDYSSFSSIRSMGVSSLVGGLPSRISAIIGKSNEHGNISALRSGGMNVSHQIPENMADNASLDQCSTTFDDTSSLAPASQEVHSAVLYVMGERSQMKTLHKSCRHRLPDVDFIPLQVPNKKRMKDAFSQLTQTWMASDNIPTVNQLMALQQRHQQQQFLAHQLRQAAMDDEDLTDEHDSLDMDLEGLLRGGPIKKDPFCERLKSSVWLSLLQLLLQQAGCIVDLMQCQSASVLLALELDSDVGAQLSCLAQILMDPKYRTLRGFCSLIDREWLSMGHDFARRSVQTSANKASLFTPCFLLFLDAVHQLICQFPLAFEFNTFFLSFLGYHHVSNRFYNFKLTCERQRIDWLMEEATTHESNSHSIWNFIEQQHEDWPVFFNFAYSPEDADKVLRPSHHVGCLQLWNYFLPDSLACGSSVYDLDHHSPNFLDHERSQYDPSARNGYNNTHVAFVNAMLNLHEGEDALGWQEIWKRARDEVPQSTDGLYVSHAATSATHSQSIHWGSCTLPPPGITYPYSSTKDTIRQTEDGNVSQVMWELNDEKEWFLQETAFTWWRQNKMMEEHRQQSLCLMDERHARRIHKHLPHWAPFFSSHPHTAQTLGLAAGGGGSSSSSSRAHLTVQEGSIATANGLESSPSPAVRNGGGGDHSGMQMWSLAHQFIRAPTTLTATKCHYCDRFLLNFGISRGIVRCALCEYLCHENCAAHVPPRCPMGIAAGQHSSKLLTTPSSHVPEVVIAGAGEEVLETSKDVPTKDNAETSPLSQTSAPGMHGSCLQNYFYKLSHHKLLQQWKERFFILDPGTYKVCYKNHENETVVQGVIDLNDVTKIHSIRPNIITHHKRSIDAYVLEIETSSRSFRLASSDQGVAEEWYESLTGLFV